MRLADRVISALLLCCWCNASNSILATRSAIQLRDLATLAADTDEDLLDLVPCMDSELRLRRPLARSIRVLRVIRRNMSLLAHKHTHKAAHNPMKDDTVCTTRRLSCHKEVAVTKQMK